MKRLILSIALLSIIIGTGQFLMHIAPNNQSSSTTQPSNDNVIPSDTITTDSLSSDIEENKKQ